MSKGKKLEEIEFAEWLKRARMAKGLSQSDLGQELDVTKQAVSAWESKKKPDMPTEDKRYKLQEILYMDKQEVNREDRALSLVEKAIDALTARLNLDASERNADIDRFERDKGDLRNERDRVNKEKDRLYMLLERWGPPPTQ